MKKIQTITPTGLITVCVSSSCTTVEVLSAVEKKRDFWKFGVPTLYTTTTPPKFDEMVVDKIFELFGNAIHGVTLHYVLDRLEKAFGLSGRGTGAKMLTALVAEGRFEIEVSVAEEIIIKRGPYFILKPNRRRRIKALKRNE